MPRTLTSCGTAAAHARHLAYGERPCQACRLAYDAAVAAHTRRKDRDRALKRALATLREDNRALFEAIYAHKRRKETDTGNKACARAYQAAMRELARAFPDDFGEFFKVELDKVNGEIWKASGDMER